MSKNKLTKLEKKILNIRWKRIYLDGSETKYEISDQGDVRNTESNKLLTSFSKFEGDYLRINLYHKGKLYAKLLHVLVAEAFVEKPIVNDDTILEVNHIDGNKCNPNAYNLEWLTRSDNIKHAIDTGLMKVKKGTEHGMNKFPESIIHQVCKLLESGKHPREISELLNVPESLPSTIKCRKSWVEISSQYNIPEVGELLVGPRRYPEKSKKYSPELIHEVCKMLEDGKGSTEISKLLNVPSCFVSDIKGRRIWVQYSKYYNIPYPNSNLKPNNRKINPIHDKAVELITSSPLSNYDKLLSELNLPNTKYNRKYLTELKSKILKQQSSTTIDQLQ